MTDEVAVMTPEAFRQWIPDHGYTQESLAAALHINRTSIHKWIKGRHPVTPTIKLAIDHLQSGNKALPDPDRDMDCDEFAQWMQANAYTDELLGDVLGVHQLSVARWRNGKHPISYPLRLALERLALDPHGLEARRNLLAVEQSAKAEAHQQASERAQRRIDAAHRRAVRESRRAMNGRTPK